MSTHERTRSGLTRRCSQPRSAQRLTLAVRRATDITNRGTVLSKRVRYLHLQELAVPPGNHLERLHGNRGAQYSIRINDQYRVCFRWEKGYANDVEITDHH